MSEYDPISLSGQITDITLKKIRRLPTQYTLSQNYPNPFNPITTLNYEIPEKGDVSLTVYDLLGKEIWNFNQRNLSIGYHSVQWDADQYASGLYFVTMIAGEYVSNQKLMLIK